MDRARDWSWGPVGRSGASGRPFEGIRGPIGRWSEDQGVRRGANERCAGTSGYRSTVGRKRKDFRTARMDRSWVGGNRRSRTWSPGIVRPIVVHPTEPGTVEGEDIFDTKDDLGTPPRRKGAIPRRRMPPFAPCGSARNCSKRGALRRRAVRLGQGTGPVRPPRMGRIRTGRRGVRRRVT